MTKLQLRLIPLALLGLAILMACNLSSPAQPGTDSGQAIYTQAAQTLVAQLTQSALQASPTSIVPVEGATQPPVVPTVTPLASPTSQPVSTNTPLPTNTSLPPTNTPRPTAAPVPCNWAKFVEDVTIPDNTRLAPGTTFTKTWKLQNIGRCTWTRDYELVFTSGDRMGADLSVEIGKTVEPGESANVSVELVAPSTSGRYRGNWMLSDDEGNVFGIGKSAESEFYVQIRVADVVVDQGVVYDFVASYCEADWESSTDGSLPCPGDEDSEDGFVIKLGNHEQENQVENEAALWTNPDYNTDGYISGEFPAIKIESGDMFLADVGCLGDNPRCNVTFSLQYRIGDGALQTLGSWAEVYDGKLTRIKIDLSALAGKSAQFVLTVEANGGRTENAAFWLLPQIYRP